MSRVSLAVLAALALAVVLGAMGATPAPAAPAAAPPAPASVNVQKVVDHDFIGGDRCRTCHAEAYAIWEKTPHARAFEALTGKDKTDPRCLSCHTMVPEDLGAGLTGVQCEACHGGGRHYAVDYVMRDPELRKLLNLQKPDGCTRCHTDSSPTLAPFVLEDKLPLIKHWK
jgi:hypothetical protein